MKGSRVPDLMFFAAARWQKYIIDTADFEGKPFVLVPDLAVEVVSPNDLYTEIQDKVDRYLNDGVRLIWVIDSQRKRVTVYEGDHYTTLGQEMMLTEGDVIPGLSLPLANLFQSHTQEKP
jgi:Uma2 family endonuclease